MIKRSMGLSWFVPALCSGGGCVLQCSISSVGEALIQVQLRADQGAHVLVQDECGTHHVFYVLPQALHLDRSKNARVTVYQDWLTAPEYPGKTEADILVGPWRQSGVRS